MPEFYFGAPFTDIRIERPHSLGDLDGLPGLIEIDLQPFSTGPEIELTFGTAPDCDPVAEDYIAAEVERMTARAVLASRRRG